MSLFVLSFFAVLVIICYACTGPLLTSMKTDKSLVEPAAYFALVLMTAIPARVLSSQLGQYFMAQGITRPLYVSGLVACGLNLLLGLILVLGVFIPEWSGFGFKGCAVVTVCVEWFQLFFVVLWYCYRQQLHRECWPGWSWSYITSARVWQYV